jgi:hypothetical protein
MTKPRTGISSSRYAWASIVLCRRYPPSQTCNPSGSIMPSDAGEISERRNWMQRDREMRGGRVFSNAQSRTADFKNANPDAMLMSSAFNFFGVPYLMQSCRASFVCDETTLIQPPLQSSQTTSRVTLSPRERYVLTGIPSSPDSLTVPRNRTLLPFSSRFSQLSQTCSPRARVRGRRAEDAKLHCRSGRASFLTLGCLSPAPLFFERHDFRSRDCQHLLTKSAEFLVRGSTVWR